MKIDTDEWMKLSDACTASGLSLSTGYRLAKSLGIVAVVFGVRVVKKKDVQTMKNNRKPMGNPTWIASYDEASAAARRAVESRMRRVEASGPTKAEVSRNKRLANIGRESATKR